MTGCAAALVLLLATGAGARGAEKIRTGGGTQTTWFVTDFMLGPGMPGGSTRIDDWR